jgi:hypothetical protein
VLEVQQIQFRRSHVGASRTEQLHSVLIRTQRGETCAVTDIDKFKLQCKKSLSQLKDTKPREQAFHYRPRNKRRVGRPVTRWFSHPWVPEEGQVTLTFESPVVTICTTRFNIKKKYVLPTQCIYVFCVDVRTNNDYFTVQH